MEWQEDGFIKEGKGNKWYKDGRFFEGEFRNDKREGINKLATGEVYEGDWKSGKRGGKRVFKCVDILITVNSKMIKEMEMGLNLFQVDMFINTEMLT